MAKASAPQIDLEGRLGLLVDTSARAALPLVVSAALDLCV
jgi:hypothetical protein